MNKKTLAISISGFVLAVASFAAGSASAEPETKTVTKKVEVASQDCLDALDDADNMILLASEGFGYAADSMGAASELDVAGMEEVNANMDTLSPKVEAASSRYVASSSACRSAE